MTCFHCGGGHDPDLCPGYSLRSINETAQTIRNGIDQLSEFDCLAVEQLSSVVGAVEGMGSQLSQSIYDIGDEIQRCADSVANAVREGTDETVGAIDRSTVINAIGFVGLGATVSSVGDQVAETRASIERGFDAVLEGIVGVGAALDYRERMDELRHEAEMELREEASVAGQAHRSIAAATALVRIDPNEAHANITRAIEAFPISGEAYRIRGTIQSILGKHEDAVKSFHAAVEFSAGGSVLPTLRPNEKPHGSLMRKAIVSSTVQLSHELLVTGGAATAVDALESGLRAAPNHPDLLLAIVKALAHDARWASSHLRFVSRLVLASPRHFNVLFLGRQLPSDRRRDLRQALNELRRAQASKLRNKSSFLDMLSKGRSEWLKLNGALCHSPDLPFVQVARLLDEASREVAQWTSGRRE